MPAPPRAPPAFPAARVATSRGNYEVGMKLEIPISTHFSVGSQEKGYRPEHGVSSNLYPPKDITLPTLWSILSKIGSCMSGAKDRAIEPPVGVHTRSYSRKRAKATNEHIPMISTTSSDGPCLLSLPASVIAHNVLSQLGPSDLCSFTICSWGARTLVQVSRSCLVTSISILILIPITRFAAGQRCPPLGRHCEKILGRR